MSIYAGGASSIYAGGSSVGGTQIGKPFGLKTTVPISPGMTNAAPHGMTSFKRTRRPLKSQPGLVEAVSAGSVVGGPGVAAAPTPSPLSRRPLWSPVRRTGTALPFNVVVVSPVHCEFEALMMDKPAGGDVMVVVIGILKTDV